MQPLTAPLHLLYIDDDRGLSRLVEKELGRQGFVVTCAADGEAGLEILRSGKTFDVCALDHYMPERDGLDVLPDILGLQDPPPVVYVTGAQEGRIAVAALRAGAADYVIKDVSEDFTALLRSAIEDAHHRRRLQRENERRLARGLEPLASAEDLDAADGPDALLDEAVQIAGDAYLASQPAGTELLARTLTAQAAP